MIGKLWLIPALHQNPRYLHHNGKPLLAIHSIWLDASRNPSAATINKIVDFIRSDPKYDATLYCGTHWSWRYDDSIWKPLYKRFDIIDPWNVGNMGGGSAAMNSWPDDITEAHNNGQLYVPVIYPGFSAHNLMGWQLNELPRRGGNVLWEQFYQATNLKVDSIYVAMFDEVDEGTAIFKITNDPPVGADFVTYEGLPSDFYLRLTGYGTRMFRGEVPLQQTLPSLY